MNVSSVLPISPAMISAPSFPTETLRDQKERIKACAKKIRTAVNERIDHCEARKYLLRIPSLTFKLVPIFLDLASTAFIPIQESLSRELPGVNLNLALVQNVIGIFSLGKKIHKAAVAIKEKRISQNNIKEAEQRLSHEVSLEEIASLTLEIGSLRKRITKCHKALFGLLHIPETISSISWTGFSGIEIALKKFSAISRPALAHLASAATIAGVITGAFTALFGTIETGLGIRKLILARKKKKTVEAKIQHLSEADTSTKGVPDEVWATLRKAEKLSLLREQLRADKNFTLSILKTAAGVIVTTAGALGIAACFTSGVAATGIAIASIVAGMVSLGIVIGAHIKQKSLEEEIAILKISNEQFDTVIRYLQSSECTDEQRQEISDTLGIEMNKLLAPKTLLSHEFRKLLCTETDVQDLAQYLCTGKGSLNQKLKFAQIFDKSVSVIVERELLLKNLINRALLKRGRQMPDEIISELAKFFLAKKSTDEEKNSIAEILGVEVKKIQDRKILLKNFLTGLLVYGKE